MSARRLAPLAAALALAGCAPGGPRGWAFAPARPEPGAPAAALARPYRLAGFFTPEVPVRTLQPLDGTLYCAPGARAALERFPLERPGDPERAAAVPGARGRVRAVASAPDGRLWLATDGGRAVVAVSPDGTPSPLTLPPGGARIAALAWHPEGDRLFGADVAGHRILRWDARSPRRPPRIFGGPGEEPGRFHYPIDVAVRRDGALLVLDSVNRRVQELDAEGGWRASYPAPGELPLERPLALALDGAGRAWVLDGGAGVARPLRVPEGLRAREVGAPARGSDLAFDERGRLWVASPLEGRIYLYALRRPAAAAAGG